MSHSCFPCNQPEAPCRNADAPDDSPETSKGLLPGSPACARSWPMTPTRQGSFRLFRFAEIDVYLHWSWFLIAAYGISLRAGRYSSMVWPALEYLTLFVIVLVHEFGHALACRQVGGQANQIVLWPLGGVAYVAPPPRPGATLWGTQQ